METLVAPGFRRYPVMNYLNIIFLSLAILSGSFAIVFMVGGILKFQNVDYSEKSKAPPYSPYDQLIINFIFRAFYNVYANWGKVKEGRIIIWIFAGCSIITFVFGYLAKNL